MRKYSVIFLMALFCLSVCACNNPSPSTVGNSNSAAPAQGSSPAQGNSPAQGGSTAQSDSDRGQAALQIEGGTVSVEYGRPALKGRELEKLIRPGQEWRMGSNAATTLTTDVDLKFGDKMVSKGKYVLKAKLDDQEKWLLLIQTEDEKPVTEVPLTFQKVERSAENMTIDLVKKGNGGSLVLHWGTLTLSTDFQKA